MSRLVPRLALIGTCAIGVSGLVAGPAFAINNYVTQPVVTGVGSLTPESAMLSGAIDTGGDPGVTFTASPAAPYSFGGLTITAPAILNGIPVGLGFYSTALFEADPLSDYIASGDQPGVETVRRRPSRFRRPPVLPPSTPRSAPTRQRAGSVPRRSPRAPSTSTGSSSRRARPTATTVNEYSPSDLANWIAGSGKITANGFGSSRP